MKIKSTILILSAVASSPLMTACAESVDSPYGVNAHLMWLSNPKERIEECKWISATGIKRVRFGLQWQYVQKSPDAPFDFSHYDRIVAEL